LEKARRHQMHSGFAARGDLPAERVGEGHFITPPLVEIGF